MYLLIGVRHRDVVSFHLYGVEREDPPLFLNVRYELICRAQPRHVDTSGDDPETKHQAFIDKFDLPFTLVADTDQKVHNLYGTWQLKKNFGKEYMGTIRTTFLLDEKGVLTQIIEKVDTKNHTAQILEK